MVALQPIDTSRPSCQAAREIDMMAIGSFSKAFPRPPVRKVTTEIKGGA